MRPTGPKNRKFRTVIFWTVKGLAETVYQRWLGEERDWKYLSRSEENSFNPDVKSDISIRAIPGWIDLMLPDTNLI